MHTHMYTHTPTYMNIGSYISQKENLRIVTFLPSGLWVNSVLLLYPFFIIFQISLHFPNIMY